MYSKLSNSQLKLFASLKLKKYRQKYNKYGLEGHKLVKEILKQKNKQVLDIICTHQIAEDWSDLLSPYKERVKITDKKSISRISSFKNSGEIVIFLELLDSNFNGNLRLGKYFYLDNIQDPGNLGTIIRIADWFGFEGILLSKESVDQYNNKCIQSSMGSIFSVPVYRIDDSEFSAFSKQNFKIIGTTLSGTKNTDFFQYDNLIIVLGNEGKGVRLNILNQCDFNFKINGYKNTTADSLNIASSASILAYLAFK